MVGLCTTLCMTASNPDLSPSSKSSKLDKPDLTKPGLTRNLAKPNPAKPVKLFHKCNPVKLGPHKNQTRLDPNQPGGTLIYTYVCIFMYINTYTYTYIYIYIYLIYRVREIYSIKWYGTYNSPARTLNHVFKT